MSVCQHLPDLYCFYVNPGWLELCLVGLIYPCLGPLHSAPPLQFPPHRLLDIEERMRGLARGGGRASLVVVHPWMKTHCHPAPSSTSIDSAPTGVPPRTMRSEPMLIRSNYFLHHQILPLLIHRSLLFHM